MEWFDTGSLQVRGVSARGHSHRFEREVRQDSLAVGVRGGFAWAAVADGLGSAKKSHIGSWSAVQEALTGKGLAAQAEAVRKDGPNDASLVDLAAHAEAIDRAAGLVGGRPAELATTLAVAAVAAEPMLDESGSHFLAVLWQLGDSEFAVLRDGRLEWLGAPADSGSEDQIFSTKTAALPEHTTARRWVEYLSPGDTLLVMSDGVANPLRGNEEFAAAVSRLWAERAPMPAALLAVLDATIKTYDDDRTLVGIRVGARHD